MLLKVRVCHDVLSVHCNLVVPCLGWANLLALFYVIFSCVFLSLSYEVFWVKCGT